MIRHNLWNQLVIIGMIDWVSNTIYIVIDNKQEFFTLLFEYIWILKTSSRSSSAGSKERETLQARHIAVRLRFALAIDASSLSQIRCIIRCDRTVSPQAKGSPDPRIPWTNHEREIRHVTAEDWARSEDDRSAAAAWGWGSGQVFL